MNRVSSLRDQCEERDRGRVRHGSSTVRSGRRRRGVFRLRSDERGKLTDDACRPRRRVGQGFAAQEAGYVTSMSVSPCSSASMILGSSASKRRNTSARRVLPIRNPHDGRSAGQQDVYGEILVLRDDRRVRFRSSCANARNWSCLWTQVGDMSALWPRESMKRASAAGSWASTRKRNHALRRTG